MSIHSLLNHTLTSPSLILTPTSSNPRSILPVLRSLPSYLCHPTLFLPTLIHSTIPTLFTTSTPLLLRSNFNIDPLLTPTSYNIATFLSSTLELFTRLPFETVLRRAQLSLLTPHHRSPTLSPGLQLDTVVPIGPYTGLLSTMWRIAREEGSSLDQPSPARLGKPKTRRGQGLAGLTRGWRVGWWALVGLWGAAAMNSAAGSKSGEF